MRLHIVHRTQYRYSEPVGESYNEVRLRPVSDVNQECHAYTLVISPEVAVRRYLDFQLNLVEHFYVSDLHDQLVVEARSEVTTWERGPGSDGIAFPLSRIGECLRLERCYDFLQASQYITLGVEIWRLAQDVVAGQADAWAAALAMMQWVHDSFVYDITATTVTTRVEDVLRDRRGVCQDFAHVLIGLCRSVKIPARYVSGYLYVGDQKDLRGDLASHAWIEVFLPGHGWLPLDPTNNRLADQHHVKVAVGRDYSDVAPVQGNFKGRATQRMEVELRITRLDPKA